MFGNNKDFYPTPENLITKMVDGIDFRMVSSILEPSAGNGNIVEYLEKKKESKYGHCKYQYSIDCIEKDNNLISILKGNGHRVVHDDFLTYETMKQYNLIIMNPPFSDGAKHLLKALEMQKHGGSIVCLLNAETIKNRCSNDRIYLMQQLELYEADIEFIENAFIDAERKTSVEVALIKVTVPKKEHKSFIWENIKKAQEIKDEYVSETNYLADNDFLKSIVNQYNMEIEAGVKLIEEFQSMSKYILRDFKSDNYNHSVLSLEINREKATVNNFVREIRSKYWSALFTNEKFIGQLTGNLRRDYYNKVKELSEYEFSLYNIYELKLDMNKNVISGIEDTIIELFDELSYQHHYHSETSNNIHYYNGWKTNKAWIINKKVIIPLNAYSSYSGKLDLEYNVKNKLSDIEKCLNYLDGGLTESIDLAESLSFAQEYGETKNIQLKYFTVTFYKKGTCHITFTNDELLKKFNIYGSQKKGWLPPSYGKKKYSEMNNEEKSVVKEFDGGEKEYSKIVSNTNYYIVNTNSFLLEQKGE